MNNEKSDRASANHYRIMRTRIRISQYQILEILAEQEETITGRRVSIADLVRDAVGAYVKRKITEDTDKHRHKRHAEDDHRMIPGDGHS